MRISTTEIKVNGVPRSVPCAEIDGRIVIATGKLLRIAFVKDEEVLRGRTVEDPGAFVRQLRSSGLSADLFTFSQRIPDIQPCYDYFHEWDNAAAVPITTYEEWLNQRVQPDVKKAIKKSARLGVLVRQAAFDDKFVAGIVDIYNDSPLRQGKPFWHYKKPFDIVKDENGTYLERSEFIGAYLGDELLGFVKLVYLDGGVAATLQVISKKSAYDKKVTNALLAKTVETCAERRMTTLVYGSFSYNGQVSSLSEFKRRNGFEEVLLPKYYVPLTAKGAIALKVNLHRGVRGVLPRQVTRFLLQARRKFFSVFQLADPRSDTKDSVAGS